MTLGLRVVRGPNWNLEDQDGGRDHVGTVVGIKGDNSVEVQWDMGFTTSCRVGDGQQDLRVFDSAPTGVNHGKAGCLCCEEICITGTLWQCAECDNVNLCTPCYYDDGHDVTHTFVRIDSPGSSPVSLPKRSKSQRTRSLGIFPGAEVTRGPDWNHGNEDGGPGKVGVVEDVVNFGKDVSDRNSVRVKWPNGSTCVCRLGFKGKVDVKCREETPGADYYIDHLGFVDVSSEVEDQTENDVLAVGDPIYVHVSKHELRQLQQGRLEWSNRMEEIVGAIGTVTNVTLNGNLEVDFDGDIIALNKGSVTKVPVHQKGDTVRAISSKEKIIRLQRQHGGWDDSMTEIFGKVGRVLTIDSDGDVSVLFQGDMAFVFHPGCLEPAPKGAGLEFTENEQNEEDESEDEDDDEKKSDSDSQSDAGTNLMQAFAGLMLLQALAQQGGGNQHERFMKAAIEGEEDLVKQMLQQNPEFARLRHNGLPCLCVAAHKGHSNVVTALLDAGADIDAVDERGNPALVVAIVSDKADTVKLLLERGADITLVNKQKRTALHAAANQNMIDSLEVLLAKGANANAQDEVGDTPLHDAIGARHDATSSRLIQHPKLDVSVCNHKGFNTLAFACLKGHSPSVDKLLSREPSLVNTKATPKRFTSLHIASINNHINEASILLVKGGAEVNARSIQDVTPLHLAAIEGYFDMAKLLLTYGADWNAKDCDGDTPLHGCMAGRRSGESQLLQLFGIHNMAEDNERIKIANLLIQHGADSDVKNHTDRTPLDMCHVAHMRQAVQTYAENNKATKPPRPGQRPQTAKVVQELFTTSTQKCHKCSNHLANARFLPCKHQVTCVKCCYKYKTCPVCQKQIRERVDKDNKKITEDGCVIS